MLVHLYCQVAHMMCRCDGTLSDGTIEKVIIASETQLLIYFHGDFGLSVAYRVPAWALTLPFYIYREGSSGDRAQPKICGYI